MDGKHSVIQPAHGYDGPAVTGQLSFLLGRAERHEDERGVPFDAYKFVIPADVADELAAALSEAARIARNDT